MSDSTIDVRHLCPLDHAHAPQITPPDTICERHLQSLRDRVRDIRERWDVLDELAGAGERDGLGQSGSKSQPPTRLDIVALQDMNTGDTGDIPAASRWMLEFADWIAAARDLNRPCSAETAITLVLVHHVALARFPDPVTLWQRVSAIRRYLLRLTGEFPRELGQACTAEHPDPQVEGPCGGAVWSTGRVQGVIAACRDCGAELTDTALLLDMMQRHARQSRFTATYVPIATQDTA